MSLPEPSTKQKIKLLPHDTERLKALCGVCNEHLNEIEQQFTVVIKQKENQLSISGKDRDVRKVSSILHDLYEKTEEENPLEHNEITRVVQQHRESEGNDSARVKNYIQLAERQIYLQNQKQVEYIDNIRNNTITFAYGPAGTGKTFLAVAAATEALYKNQIKKIILVRPAVNAGESIGFLPGDINEKFNPYLQPFYDSLQSLMPADKRKKLLSDNTIEIAPLAFMRGRTLAEAFIILDEGQNTTVEQMKMILTRIGHNSKLCITGDTSQIDLPKNQLSGLRHAREILKGIRDISHTTFHNSHVVRHRLIQKIINAYDKDKS